MTLGLRDAALLLRSKASRSYREARALASKGPKLAGVATSSAGAEGSRIK